jgi:hypothetical protein
MLMILPPPCGFVYDTFEFFFGHLGDRFGRVNTRIINENINGTECFFACFDHLPNIRFIRYIRFNRLGRPAFGG